MPIFNSHFLFLSHLLVLDACLTLKVRTVTMERGGKGREENMAGFCEIGGIILLTVRTIHLYSCCKSKRGHSGEVHDARTPRSYAFFDSHVLSDRKYNLGRETSRESNPYPELLQCNRIRPGIESALNTTHTSIRRLRCLGPSVSSTLKEGRNTIGINIKTHTCYYYAK